jgi:hypothetical protein
MLLERRGANARRHPGVIINDYTQPPLGALYPLTISGGEVRFAYVPRFDTTFKSGCAWRVANRRQAAAVLFDMTPRWGRRIRTFREGPRVRIHLPPGESLRTIGPSAAEPFRGRLPAGQPGPASLQCRPANNRFERYRDSNPRSPEWEGDLWAGKVKGAGCIFIDERADERQAEVLPRIFGGRVGGFPALSVGLFT